ncbi:hypothetical protein J6590_010296 [Homalodisca vitripennis]|nr:hypothetical protein J6590_010296 [Homalodisca vitripennis]
MIEKTCPLLRCMDARATGYSSFLHVPGSTSTARSSNQLPSLDIPLARNRTFHHRSGSWEDNRDGHAIYNNENYGRRAVPRWRYRYRCRCRQALAGSSYGSPNTFVLVGASERGISNKSVSALAKTKRDRLHVQEQ